MKRPVISGLSILLVAATFLPALIAAPAAAQAPSLKVAVVDIERVVAQSQMGREIQQRLEAFQQQVMGEVEALTEKARETQRRINEGAAALSEDRLAELQAQLEDETIAIRRLRDDKQRQGQQMQQESLKQIEKALDPIFKRLRDEEGYDLILNNVPGVVVLVKPSVDITPLVLERFNAAQSQG